MSNQQTHQAYGVWEVTTEGDCEGRTVRHLGTHTGYLDEIAFKLAPRQAYYALSFRRVSPSEQLENMPIVQTTVNVCLEEPPFSSVPGPAQADQRAKAFEKIMRGRDVEVKPCSIYGAVTLLAGKDPARRAAIEAQARRATALAKLTPEDRAALGLE